MSSFQKVVKFFGMTLAILLTVAIIGGVCSFVLGFTSSKKENENAVSEKLGFGEFTAMDIESGVADVKISTGDDYKVETIEIPESTTVGVEGSTLVIRNKKKKWYDWTTWFSTGNWNKKSKILITVPKGYEATEIILSAGVGNTTISDITTERLELDGGVGNIKGTNLAATQVSIDAGVGDVKLKKVVFADCDLDCGVGNISIEGVITGQNEINGGVGNMDLVIIGSREDYNLNVDSGVGTICVDGVKVKQLDEHGTGVHSFEIDGGVGSIDIDFRSEN